MAILGALVALTINPALSPPAEPREFRGVWVATVDNIDWPSKRGIPTEKAKAELLNIVQRASDLHLNALIFQVRPMADALYQSPLEPWSEFLTGRQGKAPEPGWDPLQFVIEEGHKRGIEVHAWFNPYRAWHPAAKGGASYESVVQANRHWVRNYGQYKWMDPAIGEVQQHSLNVMMDVVRRYDIDGVHIDDYFYPYPAGNLDFPDGELYAEYRSSGGTLSKSDWRRKNVNDFVKTLYDAIKAEKKWVKFGISPFGIFRPGVPKGIEAGIDQYEDLYADARKWFVLGWCDYFTPQLYWPIDQKPQSYRTLLKWWQSQNEQGRHLWPGNFTSQLASGRKGWTRKEIPNQVLLTRRLTPGSGNVHFSWKALRDNYLGVADQLRGGHYSERALIPASPWLDNTVPERPSVDREPAFGPEHVDLSWREEGDEPAAYWAVWKHYDGRWMFDVLPGSKYGIEVPLNAGARKLTFVSVAAVDRCGNTSDRLVLYSK